MSQEDPAKRDESGRFGAGNKANPSGRPKTDEVLRTTCRTMTPDLVERLRGLAMAADKDSTSVSACEILLAYAWGKPSQSVALEDGGGFLDLVRAVLQLPREERAKLARGDETE